jgi:hypothetical protein
MFDIVYRVAYKYDLIGQDQNAHYVNDAARKGKPLK